MAHSSKPTVSQRIAARQVEARALEALRAVCRDQEEVNALLWAMVRSVHEARKSSAAPQVQ